MSEDFGDGYKEYITDVPDFPKPGVGFKDISPLLADEQTFRSAIVDMGRCVDASNRCPDYWIGIDSRGFIFASALAIYFGGVWCVLEKKVSYLTLLVKKVILWSMVMPHWKCNH